MGVGNGITSLFFSTDLVASSRAFFQFTVFKSVKKACWIQLVYTVGATRHPPSPFRPHPSPPLPKHITFFSSVFLDCGKNLWLSIQLGYHCGLGKQAMLSRDVFLFQTGHHFRIDPWGFFVSENCAFFPFFCLHRGSVTSPCKSNHDLQRISPQQLLECTTPTTPAIPREKGEPKIL